MTFYESLAFGQVLAGAAILFFSIFPTLKTGTRFAGGLTTKWSIVTAFIVSFFMGYLLYLYGMIRPFHVSRELITSSMFLGGALFVFIVVKLTDTSTKQLQSEVLQRRQLQLMLSGAKREWEETFDIINDAITIHDTDFNVLRANKAASELLRLPFQEIIGKKCYFLYHGQNTPPDQCPSCEMVKSGSGSVMEVFEPHLNKFIEVKALPRYDEDGQLNGVVHVLRDITNRRRIEQEKEDLIGQLEEALARIKTLKGLIPICAWCKKIRDDHGYWEQVECYIEAHSSAVFTHGICPECLKKVHEEHAALGMKGDQLIKAEYPDGHTEFVTPDTLEQLISSRRITRFLRSDGWASIGSDPIRGAGGEYSGPERRKGKEQKD